MPIFYARMRGPQPVKLALDLTRTNTPRVFFGLGRSDIHMHRPCERFSRRRGQKTVIFSRFLRDCGRLEHAIINRRKTSVGTRMVHLQPEFEGQSPNESAASAEEDNEMDPLSRYGGG